MSDESLQSQSGARTAGTSWWGYALATAFVCRIAAIFAYPILDTTESRYARITLEMFTSRNWIVPYLEPGRPFWGKPPLFFWMTTASASLFGLNEFGVRIPSLLLSAVMVWIVFALGARLRNRRTAIAAATILSTMGLFHVLMGTVITDTALACALTISMAALPMAGFAAPGRSRTLWQYTFFAGIGLGLLAKGPTSLAICILAVGGWAAWQRPWSSLRLLPWLPGIALVLVIAVPWHIAAELRTPGFLKYYFVGEHFERFLVGGWRSLYGVSHDRPRGMIVIDALIGAMPWILILPAWAASRTRADETFIGSSSPWLPYFACWVIAPVVLFVASRNTIIPYVLSGEPPLALLLAWIVTTQSEHDQLEWYFNQRLLQFFAFGVPVIFLIVSAVPLRISARNKSQRDVIAAYQKDDSGRNTPIFYLGPLPDSGAFYTRGKAIEVAIKANDKVRELLSASQPVYFAVPRRAPEKFPDDCTSQTVLVATVGRYELRRSLR